MCWCVTVWLSGASQGRLSGTLGVRAGFSFSDVVGVADVFFFSIYGVFVIVVGTKWWACSAGHLDSVLIVLFERVRSITVLLVCDVTVLRLHDGHS